MGARIAGYDREQEQWLDASSLLTYSLTPNHCCAESCKRLKTLILFPSNGLATPSGGRRDP